MRCGTISYLGYINCLCSRYKLRESVAMSICDGRSYSWKHRSRCEVFTSWHSLAVFLGDLLFLNPASPRANWRNYWKLAACVGENMLYTYFSSNTANTNAAIEFLDTRLWALAFYFIQVSSTIRYSPILPVKWKLFPPLPYWRIQLPPITVFHILKHIYCAMSNPRNLHYHSRPTVLW